MPVEIEHWELRSFNLIPQQGLQADPRRDTRFRTGEMAICAILTLAVAIIALAESIHPCAAYDLWWQLRTGELITSSHKLPHTDVYSWTHYGSPWAAIEWLTFVIQWTCLILGNGYAGVLVMQALLMVALTLIVWFYLLISTRRPIYSFIWCTLFAFAMANFIQPRPMLFSYLLVTILCYLVARSESYASPGRLLPRIAALFIVWANLHQGVIIGVVILALVAAGVAVRQKLGASEPGLHVANRTSPALLLAGAATIAAACSFVSPYGIDLMRNVFVTMTSQSAMSSVSEWKGVGALPLNSHDCASGALAIATLSAFVLSPLRRAAPGLFVCFVMAVEAIAHHRNIPFFLIVASFFAAPLLCEFALRFRASERSSTGSSTRRHDALAALIALVAVTLVCIAARQELGPVRGNASLMENLALTVFEARSFAEPAMEFIETEKFPRDMRFYNDYNLGSYMILRLPQYKVFVDGRADIYAGSFLDSELNLYHMPGYDVPSNPFLNRYDLDVVFTELPGIALKYWSDPTWSMVYTADNTAIRPNTRNQWIFVRNRPEYISLISKCHSDWSDEHQGQLPDLVGVAQPKRTLAPR